MAAQHNPSTSADFSSGKAGAVTLRLPGIDSLRGAGVLAMFAAHVARVVPPATDAEKLGLYEWLMRFEPAISACFLCLVGWCLAWSYQHSRPGGRWYARCCKRALLLYACGVVLFTLQHGPNFPDALLSPDILSVIAAAIVVVGACLSVGGATLWAAAAVVLALALSLESAELSISGLNAGPGGVVPALAFALFGAALATPRRLSPITLCVVCLSVSLLAFALPGELVLEHRSVYRSSGASGHPVWFWNHTARAVLVLSGPLAVLLTLASRPRPAGVSKLNPLAAVGRHALVVYVGHLLTLGVVGCLLGVPLKGGATLILSVLGLAGLALQVSLLLESRCVAHWRARLHERTGVRL